MNNLSVYFLVVIYCINIFGAGVSEILHFADHAINSTEIHHHSHGDHTHGDHSNAIHSHEHSPILVFISKVFEDNDNDFQYYYNLNFLMLIQNTLLNEHTLALNIIDLTKHYKNFKEINFYSFDYSEINTPPPRLFS